ncbi:hypothetical protein LK994_12500 [Ferruginibacter lapsinanis]|uniref:hypothetical protein n=1 Tax=Ferruginibacter lapsinanis TaxID=563172 RepID=UPI001E48B49B|nr:hypothetical protein [Ferruginibacter lapsinanis]UEG49453.1 hypothetical protein LK994_12500 [Ferruginibacter lapsinanis]
MHILFITTHNFATNPRLVKEINLALTNNYKATVVCFDFDNWSKQLNNKFKSDFNDKGVSIIEIPAGRKPFLSWLFSTVVNKLSKGVSLLNPSSIKLIAYQFNKRSWLLNNALNNLSGDFDLIVAHNPGSFYPAFHFSKQKKIPFGIDIEDYHPGEASNEAQIGILKKLQNEIFPHAMYCSAASPLILEYCKADLAPAEMPNDAVIYNLFSAEEFVAPQYIDNARVKIVWFSQNIAAGRGLEEVVPVIKKLADKFELHLFGNLNKAFANEWLTNAENIYTHDPLLQSDLHKQLSLFDIGLAIEPGKDLNNNLAVSNKIFAYMQSGLYIIASSTMAQKRLLNDFPDIGIITSLDNNSLEQTFLDCYNRMELIRSQKANRFQRAGSFSWETEGNKLLLLWKLIKK